MLFEEWYGTGGCVEWEFECGQWVFEECFAVMTMSMAMATFMSLLNK